METLVHKPPEQPVVALQNVSRVFEGPPPVHALRPTNLQIEQGEYVAIVGPSGSGKSTLLNLLGLLDVPTEGKYFLNGTDVGESSQKERAGLRAQHVGFVFQSFHLLDNRTTVENVALAEVYRPGGSTRREQRAKDALKQVSLGHRLEAYPTTLSGGERQRVAIARAIISQPSLLLADEPTGNLDTATGEQILALFDQLHNRGMTLAVITHEDEVAARAQRRIQLRDGVVTQLDRTTQRFTDPLGRSATREETSLEQTRPTHARHQR